MASIENLLIEALAANRLTLTQDQQQRLIHYLTLIQTWNRVFNLTTITEPRDMVYLHLIDSLIIQPYLHGSLLLDVGSGAGLPGIPLAMVNPEQQWVLVDKNSKKTRFLTQAVAELSLTNVKVVHSASEAFHPTTGFDSILSRAFGTIRMFTETTEHLLSPQGLFIAMKGKYPHDELQDLDPRFTVRDVVRLEIQGMETTRHVICISKG